jgi:NifB/MoaA-like Fe-S oxidoreductase
VLVSIASDLTALTGIAVDVRPVENRFFGPRVNVSGLLTAGDLRDALLAAPPADLALLPRYSLDYTGRRFLDDVTPEEVQESVGVPLAFASNMTEVLQILGQPLESGVAGARAGVTSNGKSWSDHSR